ncbi:glycosyltransferase family 4 protein [Rhodomicrobium sp.]|uniref:glycosyltransferase family 4 protein n=1 Tax=Rhodomicrobium sp. TaxID=2720632 RepID=UPI0039E35356
MTRFIFAFSGDLETPTGNYAYARKILPPLKARLGLEVLALPAGFPLASGDTMREALAALRAASGPDTVLFLDGLVGSALPADELGAIAGAKVALVHHPLALEDGLDASTKARLLRSEADALALADAIIVPSEGTARDLTRIFDVPPGRLAVALPGVLRGFRAEGSPPGEPLHIVSAGTLTPRKGHAVLVDALAQIADLPWRATIAGALDLSPETAAAVRAKIAAHGLGDRVRLAGHVDEAALSALYASGDIFALASFHEGYGMVFAEAMAHGLPVVASGDGAVRDTVPGEAGHVCAAGDADAIAAALRSLSIDAGLRRRMAEAAWRHGQTLPSWDACAAIIARVLEKVAHLG